MLNAVMYECAYIMLILTLILNLFRINLKLYNINIINIKLISSVLMSMCNAMLLTTYSMFHAVKYNLYVNAYVRMCVCAAVRVCLRWMWMLSLRVFMFRMMVCQVV